MPSHNKNSIGGLGEPEADLIVLCASPHFDDLAIRRLAEGALNWELLLRYAERHAIAQLIFWRLKPLCTLLPRELEAVFQSNARHSLWLTRELLHLCRLFELEAIPLLPFKGPTLAMAAYGNLILRQFVDLDLLVRKSDALRARDMLLANGYQSIIDLSPRREQTYLDVYDEFALSKADGSAIVELHWAITPRKFAVPLDTSKLWDSAASVSIAHKTVASLGLEDLLLVLCVHGTKHCWNYLSLVADVAWLIARHAELDCNIVLERAQAVGVRRMVLLGLNLAHVALQAPVPITILQQIKGDLTVGALTRQVLERYWEADNPTGSVLAAGKFHMKARERWQDRGRYLYRLTTTAGVEDWEIVDLHPRLEFLYSFLRYPRLLRKYWLRAP